MLKGFKEFIMRGNLVELAVAFIMAAAFAAVVTALVDVIMGFIGKLGGQPNFDGVKIAGVVVGTFITALISFIILAAVVYLFIVVPYNKLQERRARGQEPEQIAPAEDVALLQEIRDLLAARSSSSTGPTV
ncbi:MAG TPA: large conductance mechanosensitive channel protein MscL [Nocardioidaceae bacterium]|nr:large conductance mechanosensitive channel protein MscL [Nocardioidaceae bacterium]